MRNTRERGRNPALAMLCVAAGVFLLSSCAVNRVYVSEKWSSPRNIAIDLEAVVPIWEKAKSGQEISEEERSQYNLAVRRTVVQIADNWEKNRDSISTIRTSQGPVNIALDSSAENGIAEVNHLAPAEFIRVQKGLSKHVKIDGFGSPMVARRAWTEHDPMVPKSGLWFPLTALLDLDHPERPVLTLRDPSQNGGLCFPGTSNPLPMAADYTAFIAQDFKVRQEQILDIPALFRFEWFQERMGLQRISNFDPNKEPCVLVHGINSSPSTWTNLVNEMMADKEIRERYEFWTFGYPSGAPIPYLALQLRDSIDQMIASRNQLGAGKSEITMVGHSMGGLLSKTLAQSSGVENWQHLFRVPPEELKISTENRELLRRMLYFEPNESVERIIFIATPHKGSAVAQAKPAKLVGELIQLPHQLVQVSAELLSGDKSQLTPLGLRIAKEIPTSVDQLSSESDTMQVFSAIPLSPKTRYFSIIANNSRPGKPLEKSSDSLVNYASSHLEVAEREIVVPGNHRIHRSPTGVRALKVLLKAP